MNRTKYLIKNVGLLTLSSFSSKILVFLMVPLYTGVLSTQEYGEYDLVSTTIQLLIPILSLNINEAVMRFLMESKRQDEILSIGLKYVLIATLIMGIGLSVNIILSVYAPIKNYSMLIFLYFFASVFYQYTVPAAKGMEKVLDISIAGTLATVCTVVLNVMLLLKLKAGLRGFYVSYIFGQLTPATYLVLKTGICKRLKIVTDKKLNNDMVKYAAPMITNSLGWWVNNISDRYVVTAICGVAINGIYSVSYKIPTILTTIQQIFIQAWQISAIKESDKKDAATFYGHMIVILNCVTVIGCIMLIWTTKIIAHFLYAKDFFDAWRYVPFLLLSSVINSASGILGPILNADKNSLAMGRSAVVGAATNILLNIVLVRQMGAQGAAIATAISSYVIYRCRLIAVGDRIKIERYYQLPITWILLAVQSCALIFELPNIYQIFTIIVNLLILFPEIKRIKHVVVSYKNKIGSSR